MTLKKLIAFDEDDLAVLSAHLQDAKLKASDMAYLAQEHRFALVAERFCREEGADPARVETRPAGLHFERVLRVRSYGFEPGSPQLLHLLALQFHSGEAPAGTCRLIFAGEAEIRLDVECLEAAMSDLELGEGRCSCPDHAPLEEGVHKAKALR